MSGLQNSFKCFKHPIKLVEAVCTDPQCSNYRFFCVTCFLENTSHYIGHKESICEIGDLLNEQQFQNGRQNINSGEIDQQIQKLGGLMKENDQLIRQKKQSYNQILRDLENKFQEMKLKLQVDLEQQLEVLGQKQSLHYQQIKKKIEAYRRDSLNEDWRMVRKKNNEEEITGFFENLIRKPSSDQADFKREIKFYIASFQKNLNELDGINNHKLIQICVEEFKESIQDKFVELKELLNISFSELNSTFPPKRKIKQDTNEIFKNYRTPQSDSFIHNNAPNLNNSNLGGSGIFNQFNGLSHINQDFDSVFSEYPQKKFFGQILEDNQNNNKNELSNFLMKNKNNFQQNKHFQKLSDSAIEAESDHEIEVGTKFKRMPSNLINNNAGQKFFNDNENTRNTFEDFQRPVPKKINNQIENQEDTPQPVTHSDGITCIIFYENSVKNKHIIATGSLDCNIKLWHLDSNSFDLIKTLSSHTYGITNLHKFSKDQVTYLASASQNHEIKIWNPTLKEGSELITTLIGHTQMVNTLIYFERYLISGSKDKSIKVWDLNELKCIESLAQPDSSDFLGINESENNGNQLVSNSGDGFRIYNYHQNGVFQLKSYNKQAHRSGLCYLKVIKAPEVDMFTCGKDGIIKLWNILKGQCIGTLTGHTQQIYSAQWLSEKKMLLTASLDGNIKIWDLKDCIKSVEANHCLNKEQNPLGEFIVLQEHSCILSVGNGNNFIKIIYV